MARARLRQRPTSTTSWSRPEVTAGDDEHARGHERGPDYQAGPGQHLGELVGAHADRGADRSEHEHESAGGHGADSERSADRVRAAAAAVLGADPAGQVGGQEREPTRVDGRDRAGDEGEAGRAATHAETGASRIGASLMSGSV